MKRSWKKNRIRTYQNSMRYFMMVLKDRQLKKKGFEVNKLIRVNKDSLPPLPEYSPWKIEEMLHGGKPLPAFSEPKDSLYPNQAPYDSIIGVKTDRNYMRLRFDHSLRVLIPPPRQFTTSKPKSTWVIIKMKDGDIKNALSISVLSPTSKISIITMVKPETYIDPNGVLTDPLAVSVEGFWAFRQIADLLPFNYRVSEAGVE